MKRINLGNLRRILISLPRVDEQESIAERLQSIQEQIEITLDFREKLRREKCGLMDDVLTGRVRVTPLIAQSQL